MKYLLLLTSSLVIATPALAGEVAAEATADTTITVLGTGLEEPVDQTGQSIAVVGVEELQSVQGADITRVLERLPGVVFSRNGGPGGFTGVRVRGAEAEQLLVLVDGVRMDDPSQPSGGTSFGNLLAGNLEKVELLRGSNSVVWGSQAIGGVVALTTRQLEGAEFSAEYGAYDTFTGTAVAGGSSGGFSGTIAAGYTRSDGFSELSADPEADGYRQWELAGKAGLELGGGFSLSANGRHADSRREIDGFGVTSDDVQFTKETSGRLGLGYTSDTLDLTASGALYDISRYYEGSNLGAQGLFFDGRTYQAELKGRWRATSTVSLIFGGGNDWSQFRDAGTAEKTASLSNVHGLVEYRAGGAVLAAGVRYDHHNQFGGQWNFGANGSYEFAPAWRIRASYGEGFKTPTLYQLNAFGSDFGFTFAGNPALLPERSRSYEIGIEHGDRNDALHLAATAFRRDSTNLIAFVGCDTSNVGICAANPGNFMFGTYANIGKARAEGFELEFDARPDDRLSVHAVYSYVKSSNLTPGDFFEGRDLARRPRHAVTFAADWRTPLHDLTIGGDIRLVSDSFDSNFSNTQLDGYVLLGLRASLPVTERFEVFGRIENLTDQFYETARGYGTAGRSAYAGVRARF